jgi:hypothetical protein
MINDIIDHGYIVCHRRNIFTMTYNILAFQGLLTQNNNFVARLLRTGEAKLDSGPQEKLLTIREYRARLRAYGEA